MDNLLKKLRKARKEIKLPEERKDLMRKNLINFMAAGDAVRERVSERHLLGKGSKSIFGKIFLKQIPMPIFAIILVVSLVGGGTSFAAEGSIPGDVLYPVKVHFNEEVRAALSLSADAKANWEEIRAERRLEELAKLSASEERKSDAGAFSEAEKGFEDHSNRVKAHIADLKARGKAGIAADLATDLEIALKVHSEILGRFEDNEGKGDAKENIRKAGRKLKEELRNIGSVRAEAEAEVNEEGDEPEVKTAAEGRIKAASHIIDSVLNYIEDKYNKFGASSTIEAETKLAMASSTLLEAELKLDSGNYSEAFNLASRAIALAKEAKSLAKAGAQFRIKLQEWLEGKGRDHDDDKDNSSSSVSGEDESDGDSADDGSGHNGIRIEGSVNERLEKEDRSTESGKEKDEIHGDVRVDLNLGL